MADFPLFTLTFLAILVVTAWLLAPAAVTTVIETDTGVFDVDADQVEPERLFDNA